MKANPRINYDTSSDYQLPPGELWWLCSFTEIVPWPRENGRTAHYKSVHVNILFFSPDIQTWYQANQAGQIAIREYFGGDCELPSFKVTLWEQ
jgi:hypothetical protein